jgi:hypothetical protein
LNSASGDYSAVGGGRRNTASDTCATVGGGYSNTASDSCATVGGGVGNYASGEKATIPGGCRNTASGAVATVGGGGWNTASGDRATVPGGRYNDATGNYSFAAGQRAKAYHIGAFVWADSTNIDFTSSAINQFNVRASGGVRMFTNAAATLGAQLLPNATAWTALSDSTTKRNIRRVNTKDILERVAALPISQWSYKGADPSIEHIGPMAQDFWKLFHLGEDSLGISTIDPDGIALAAIQELQKENAELRAQNNRLQERLEKVEVQLQQLTNQKTTTTEQANLINRSR